MRAFLKSVRENPVGTPFFLAWAAATIVADGIAMVLLSDVSPRALTGGSSSNGWNDRVISAFLFGKVFFQAWLIFPRTLRRFFWVIISGTHLGLLLNIVSPYRRSSDDVLLIFSMLLIGEALIFLRVRRRFWLGAALAALFPYMAGAWRTAVVWTLQLLTDKFAGLSKYLYITQDEAIYYSASTLHTLLTGAVIAWLMPPISKPNKTESPACVR